MAEKHVYRFGMDENGNNVTEVAGKTVDEAKWITGGKGANLAEMANIGLPVPPGFSITCQTCVAYSSAGNVWPEGVLDEIDVYRKDLEKRMGKKLGDKDDPLLVSVRSGAPFSMPGMMDTVLNLGLNDDSVLGLIKKTNNERFGWDSYRRFVQMFSDVVMGVDGQLFEDAINAKKAEKGVKLDTELDAADLKDLVKTFKQIFTDNVDPEKYPEVVENGKAVFPSDPYLQLRLAEQAVFGSWNTPRAILYRKQNKIPDDLGTAVNVQVMVFGNMGDTSATGVAFTRNPADGTNERYGDFLVNAQGEDVVAGIRNTQPIADLPKTPGLEQAGKDLYHVFEILEDHYADMMDLEFTIQEGKLWMLQTRVGKRTALSALKVAIDMYNEGRISKEEAVMRVAPEQLDQLLHPQFDPSAKYEVLAKGLNASPGAATGAVVFSSEDAEKFAKDGKPCILVRWETTPDDLKGMVAAEGILTSHGGKTSHAAVIARGMGAPCVCGVEALQIDAPNKVCKVAGTDVELHEGDVVSIDGTTGDVILGEVPLVRPQLGGDLETILDWADEVRLNPERGRVMGVRANADNPADAQLSADNGAEGIGLDRTEHMFLGDRKQLIQSFILADDEATKQEALEKLGAAQKGDFLGMFKAMDGKTVIVRLLDPPLHEFLDNPRALDVEIAKDEAAGKDVTAKRALMDKLDSFQEANPMLGLRGCRLGLVYPELNVMQVRAIAGATAELKKQGFNPKPEIMVPLVAFEAEIEQVRAIIEENVKAVAEETGVELDIPVGTMIELPRAAIMSEDIAKHADFFSFGTNDLTQTCLGFSRDDVESAFMPLYLEKKIVKTNPFATLDEGVAKLVDMGVKGGHKGNPDIVCGVCGETGGDPESIHMYYDLGLDYVSCSPYRVPIARLAAAQAKIESNGGAQKVAK
ncbi:MAG: pyruvate, phosphate dikinase [Tractidigestivibacter sp.]|jgi:pyruvate,orthophosphate dikinase|uniref:pyruvate, phosphate dikinase n=1 Tax=Tractidigestivibacter sp. TaxID=2847320 RepID=UPI003D8C0261